MRMKKNVLSWFRHVKRMSDERMVQKMDDEKVSGNRGRGRPRLTFENTVSKILEEGHVNSMRTPRRACRDCSVRRSILSDYPTRHKA